MFGKRDANAANAERHGTEGYGDRNRTEQIGGGTTTARRSCHVLKEGLAAVRTAHICLKDGAVTVGLLASIPVGYRREYSNIGAQSVSTGSGHPAGLR